jgi:pimeloyl-ACP methyl ester carboxylesterase
VPKPKGFAALTLGLLLACGGLWLWTMGPLSASTDELPSEVYTSPGQLIEVERGRSLNLLCFGEGSPVVMLESGAWGSAAAWRRVQGSLASFTRTCSYDRAGLGFSDPAQRPSSADNIADDLHRLIAAAGIQKPLILVGHSAGGAYALTYAAQHRRDVAGLVLLDPYQAEFDHALSASGPAGEEVRKWAQRESEKLARDLETCLSLARADWPSVKENRPSLCAPQAGLSILAREMTRQSERPHTWEAMLSESISLSHEVDGAYSNTDLQVLASLKDAEFDDLPIFLLTPATRQAPPELSQNSFEAALAVERTLQKNLVAGSRSGKIVPVQNSGHQIQLDQPQTVIDATEDLVLSIRKAH